MCRRSVGKPAEPTIVDIVLAVYRHITNPGCRQYLLRQAFEEAVHKLENSHLWTSAFQEEVRSEPFSAGPPLPRRHGEAQASDTRSTRQRLSAALDT